jgi:hypothetical protein
MRGYILRYESGLIVVVVNCYIMLQNWLAITFDVFFRVKNIN